MLSEESARFMLSTNIEGHELIMQFGKLLIHELRDLFFGCLMWLYLSRRIVFYQFKIIYLDHALNSFSYYEAHTQIVF